MPNRGGGDETRLWLREWTAGQTRAERLAGQVLDMEGFESINPIHPLGGRDGLKDMICWHKGTQFIAAVYFPTGQKRFKEILDKFKHDLEGVQKNQVGGLAFVANQKLIESERKQLQESAPGAVVEIYHLDRLTHLLNTPRFYGIRMEYLDIEVSKEELTALIAETRETFRENQILTDRLLKILEDPEFSKAESKIREIQSLRASRFLLHDTDRTNIPAYRYLAVLLNGSLNNAIARLVDSSSFDEFVEKSTGKPLTVLPLPKGLRLQDGDYRFVGHASGYPILDEPTEDVDMIEAVSREGELVLNQAALNIYRFVHGELLASVKSDPIPGTLIQ